MNLISGLLLTLWVAGWAVASLREVRKARANRQLTARVLEAEITKGHRTYTGRKKS